MVVSEKMLSIGFLFVTIAYIAFFRFIMSSVQDEINKIKFDNNREYTFERAGNVLLKRISTFLIPSLILIYYAFFVTYTSVVGETNGFKMQAFFDPLAEDKGPQDNGPQDKGPQDKGSQDNIWTLIGGLFIVFSISILMVTNIVIIFVKALVYTTTFATTLMYIVEVIKYILFLGLIGGAVLKMSSSSLLNKKEGNAFIPALVKYLTAFVFYIPCMVTNAIADVSATKRNTPKHVIIVFILQLCLISFNVFVPMIDKYLSKHLVNTIIKGPIYLSNEYNYSDTDIKFVDISGCVKEHVSEKYDCKVELMDEDDVTEKIQQDNIDLYFPGKTKLEIEKARGILSDDPNNYKERTRYDYNYAYAFWFYINSSVDNKDKDLPMINFADNPNVNYNPVKNQLKIVYDTDTVVLNHIQLQKWNHLVINYTSGRLDVFINGDLANTKRGMQLNTVKMKPIISGQYDGINGRIANVVYYHKPLPKLLIDHLYNSGKGKEIPTGGGIFSTLWITVFNKGEAKTMDSISDGISTGLTYVLPTPDYLENIYKYFENLPHNITMDTWYLIDEYIFMFDTMVDNKDNAIADKYKKTTQLM